MSKNIDIGFVKDSVTYYFGYGSNMNEARVIKREMPYTQILPGQLHGYELRFNKRSLSYPGAASANVQPSAGAVVEGVLYKLVDEQSIEYMDPFEGYPVLYSRFLMPVQTQAGAVDAWVYTANPIHVREGLKPARWYLNHLLAGEAYLSPDYFSRLAQTLCLADSDIEPD